MSESYELDAFVEQDGVRRPFHLRISEPERTSGGEDCFCRVAAPLLLGKEKNIYGVDEKQARTLAFQFIRELLGELRLVEGTGRPVRF